MWRFKIYGPEFKDEWDNFVAASRNSTFLFQRDYMDYHSDRFKDMSMMAYKDSRLVGLLPANITEDNALHSHQGLTYGGWILPPRHLDTPDFMEMWDEWISFCRESGIKAIDYKPLPYIYSRMPSGEDEYALWRSGAEMTACAISSTIDLSNNPGYNSLQRRHLRNASKMGLTVADSDDVAGFIDMLKECLDTRHGATPVHTAEELRLLKDRFPENIRLYTVTKEGRLYGGVCMYGGGMVAHSQYIATTEEGRRQNVLSLLFDYLINDVYADYRYFDFGISTEEQGKILNKGLSRQKSSLGGSGVPYRRYQIIL